MADEWYYSKRGQRVGPVSEAQLNQLVASGQIQPPDLVWKQGMAQWVQVRHAFPPPAQDRNVPPPIPEPPRAAQLPTALAGIFGKVGSFLSTPKIDQSQLDKLVALRDRVGSFLITPRTDYLRGYWHPITETDEWMQFTTDGAVVFSDGSRWEVHHRR